MPGFTSWRARPKARASASTGAVITLPAAMKARSPILIGATKVLDEPMNTSWPILVRCLATPS